MFPGDSYTLIASIVFRDYNVIHTVECGKAASRTFSDIYIKRNKIRYSVGCDGFRG